MPSTSVAVLGPATELPRRLRQAYMPSEEMPRGTPLGRSGGRSLASGLPEEPTPSPVTRAIWRPAQAGIDDSRDTLDDLDRAHSNPVSYRSKGLVALVLRSGVHSDRHGSPAPRSCTAHPQDGTARPGSPIRRRDRTAAAPTHAIAGREERPKAPRER